MIENIKVLVVDDEPHSTQLLRKVLNKKGYKVVECNDSLKAKDLIRENYYDIIVSDLQMPDVTGLDLLKIKPENTIFIMITGFGSVTSAVDSMKHGAYDYINKPFNLEEFIIKVDKAAENIRLNDRIKRLKSLIEGNYSFSNIVGKSKKIVEVFEFIKKVSGVNVNVLIEGRSGTGKELVAKAIHYNSPRKDKPFIAINCSAIPDNLLESELFGHTKGAFTGATDTQKGVFELAEGGTLLLDEIAEMPYALQAKLLRVTENWEIKPLGSDKVKKIDIRLISATNKNMKEALRNKTFREDLYYRISTLSISIPPLSERKEDIPLISEHYLKTLSAKLGKELKITPQAYNSLMNHVWKGNIRELENVLEQAAITSETGVIDAKQFSFFNRNTTRENESDFDKAVTLKELEKIHINKLLTKTGGNKQKTAQILGIDRKTLYKKLKEYNLG